MYFSKPSSEEANLASASARVMAGGESDENYSQGDPHLEVHHLHLGLISTWSFAGGVTSSSSLKRYRLKGHEGDSGDQEKKSESR